MKHYFLRFFCSFSYCILCLVTLPAWSYNIAYVEINDHEFANVGCYVQSDNGQPFFDMATIMAANINGDSPNHAYVFFNPEVTHLLNNTNTVQKLQQQGIKVYLTVLGNHENAGWGCFTDDQGIKQFANQIVDIANRYQLDGIDIDDEYSTCVTEPTSLVRIAQAIKTHPGFKGKVLTKALFADRLFFYTPYKGHYLAEYLDYGFEMSYFYSDYERRLSFYVQNRMDKAKLALGIDVLYPVSSAIASAKFVNENNYGGVMVYNVANTSGHVLNEIAKVSNHTIKILPNCLQ